jgi:hypothetical protein
MEGDRHADGSYHFPPSPSARANRRHSARQKARNQGRGVPDHVYEADEAAARARAERAAQGGGFDDHYYGMDINHADNVDPLAFQPSHTMEFELQPAETLTFWEDVTPAEAAQRKVLRGDWFVTSGDELSLAVTIFGPDNAQVYQEGPLRPQYPEHGDPVYLLQSEGSFKFHATQYGAYRLEFRNPSFQDSRTVTFGFLKGRDDDDAFIQKYKDDPDMRKHVDDFTYDMLDKASALHRKLDEISALQQHADVRFKRHLNTAASTNGRVLQWTLIELLVYLLIVVGAALVMRRFRIKYRFGSTWGA